MESERLILPESDKFSCVLWETQVAAFAKSVRGVVALGPRLAAPGKKVSPRIFLGQEKNVAVTFAGLIRPEATKALGEGWRCSNGVLSGGRTIHNQVVNPQDRLQIGGIGPKLRLGILLII